MRTEVQTQLARLLAKENINIIHGEYRTAFFDVEKRTLGLPIWKDRGKDVYDLLVGHEVGHALFTPAEGWHDSDKEVPGVPRSFLNVIEDIRIERKVREDYPGLVASFLRGYNVLYKENFFGTEDRDLQEYLLIDRINLKSKLGNLVDVEFSDEELPLFKKAMAVDSWEDVLEVSREIHEFMMTEAEQEDEEPGQALYESENDGEEMDISNEGMPSDNNQRGEETDDSNETSGSGDNVDESSDREDGGSSSSASNDEPQDQMSDDESVSEDGSEADSDGQDMESDRDSRASGEDGGVQKELKSETDEAFRQAETELAEQFEDGDAMIVRPPSKQDFMNAVIPYEELRANRQYELDRLSQYGIEERFSKRAVKEEKSFYADNKRVLNLMVKEFEMRKAAFQYSRAKSSKSGSLDVNKLHSYKYNDDIFLRVTQLADAKSHGLVMFMDRSGSMSSVLSDVIRQTVLLAEFCRRVNIPFVVYGFTTSSQYTDRVRKMDGHKTPMWGSITIDNLGIIEMLSSNMKKAVFKEAVSELFRQAAYTYHLTGYDALGATPLIETIMASHYLVKAFQKKHQIQNPVALFLTDGDPTRMGFGYDRSYNDNAVKRITSGIKIPFANADHSGSAIQITTSLMKTLRKTTGAKTVAVHLCDNNKDARRWMWTRSTWEESQETFAKYRKNKKMIHLKDFGNFDHAFVMDVKGDRLKAKDDDFVVDDDLSNRKLTTAFKNFNKSKRDNRVLMTSFAAAIA